MVIVLATLWFWIPVAGLLLLALVWLNFIYRKPRARVWGVIRARYAPAGPLFSVLVLLAAGLGLGIGTYRFGVELISVPSSSMETAIHAGNYILVNKLKPGPRRFASMPDKYFRMRGTSALKRGDIVLFNFPEGDTILENRPNESYYYLKRHFNEFDRLRKIRQWGQLLTLEVKNRPRFVKRLAGLPGDTLQIIDGKTFVNGQMLEEPTTLIQKFRWTHTREAFTNVVSTLPILNQYTAQDHIEVEMTIGNFTNLDPAVKAYLKPSLLEKNVPDRHIFPFNTATGWNTHHLGPIFIPSAGDTIQLTLENLPLYQRAICVYEGNVLETKGGQIFINGKPTDQYCFIMNYYWAMGDNRPHSFDSRFWGFLPENHIIGSIPPFLINKKQ